MVVERQRRIFSFCYPARRDLQAMSIRYCLTKSRGVMLHTSQVVGVRATKDQLVQVWFTERSGAQMIVLIER